MTKDLAHKEVGRVSEVKDHILTVEGLPSARINDILVTQGGVRAIVRSLSLNTLEAFLLDTQVVIPGTEFFVDTQGTCIRLSDELKGSVLNGLGVKIASPAESETSLKGKVGDEERPLTLDVSAPNVDARDFIRDQLITGFSLVDILLPVGKGQRELIYGPQHSGKEEFLRDVVVSQKEQGNICIYAAIGKPSTFTARLVRSLEDQGAMDNTIIVSALSDEMTPLIALAPSTALFIAEYFCERGEDVVLILDDLGLHAKYLRESALLSGHFPGRESYPGDIFYQHAHLIERAGSFNEKRGNGTITLFPVLEVDEDSLSTLIPTNLMASTDGHLFFSKEMHTEGHAPAISVTRSVTRVGHVTQTNLQQELSTRLMEILSEYPRQQEYSRFGTQMSPHTKDILKKGRVIYELLDQSEIGYLSSITQVLLLSLVFTSFFDDSDAEAIRSYWEVMKETLEEGGSFKNAREAAASSKADLDGLLEMMKEGVDDLKEICQASEQQKKN